MRRCGGTCTCVPPAWVRVTHHYTTRSPPGCVATFAVAVRSARDARTIAAVAGLERFELALGRRMGARLNLAFATVVPLAKLRAPDALKRELLGVELAAARSGKGHVVAAEGLTEP